MNSNTTENVEPIHPTIPAHPFSTFSRETLIIVSFWLAVVFVTLLVAIARRKVSSRGNVVLLVGPPDAGKTALLSKLVYNQTLPTYTSLQTNSSIVTLPSKTIQVIDVPGHPRVRDQFREHLTEAKVVAFVVDASTVSRNGAAVAEHLHHVLHALTSLPANQAIPTLLILAHKADVLKSSTAPVGEVLAVNRVKTILERELEKRRLSQSGGVGVEGLGEEGERLDMGGLECSDNAEFRFAEWEGGNIELIGTHVKVGDKEEVDDEKAVCRDGLSTFRERLCSL